MDATAEGFAASPATPLTMPTEQQWNHFPAIEAAARSAIAKKPGYLAALRVTREELTQDLATWALERIGSYDEAKGQISTWATLVCSRRLIDLLRAATGAHGYRRPHAQLPPEELPASGKKSEFSVTNTLDTERRLAALAQIARYQAATVIPPAVRKGPRPLTDAQLAAILVVRLDRRDSFRGTVLRLRASSSLRDALDLTSRQIPSWMALLRASSKWWGKPETITLILTRTLQAMGELEEAAN